MAKGLKDFVAAAKATVEGVSTADVVSKLDGTVLLLDVREPSELQAGMLPSALNVPRGVPELKADLEFPMREPRLTDREQEIVVYCASGGRSLLAAATLLEMGFSNVKSMACGFGSWQQDGHKVVGAK